MNFITIKYLNNNFVRLLLYFESIYLFIADKGSKNFDKNLKEVLNYGIFM